MAMPFNAWASGIVNTNGLNGSSVIIWAWQNDIGLWTAYDPQLSNEIERNHQNGIKIINIGNINPALSNYYIDLTSMKQIRMATGNSRDVSRLLLSYSYVVTQGIVWEFESVNQWTAYDYETINQIEAAFLKKASQLDLSHLKLPYKIDFQQMIQIRCGTHTARKIRRRQLSHQYLADYSNTVSVNGSLGLGIQSWNFGSSGQTSGNSIKHSKSTSRVHPYNNTKVSSSSSNNQNHLAAPSLQKSNIVYRQIPKRIPSDPSQAEPVTESLPHSNAITIERNSVSNFARSGLEVLGRYMTNVYLDLDKNDCTICFEKLSEPSSYGTRNTGNHDVVQLSRCSHQFHKLCLLAMYNSSHKGDSLQCPSCNTICGEKTGNCPPGTMKWNIDKHLTLSGYEGYNTICITYLMPPGIQGPEHPQPGKPYTVRGFPRQGYLPDCNKGRKVLKLLMEAFRRRLMFTIGTSHTTGEHNTLTWNEIHHKTEPHGNAHGHGYPDPKYLDNVLLELASHGVTE